MDEGTLYSLALEVVKQVTSSCDTLEETEIVLEKARELSDIRWSLRQQQS